MKMLYMFHLSIILSVIAPTSSTGNEPWQGNVTTPLGGIQEAIEILQGNVLTLTKLVTVTNQKVDTNTRTVMHLNEKIDTTINTVSKLDQKVHANSEAVTTLSKKIDSTSSTVSSLKQDVEKKVQVVEKTINSEIASISKKMDSEIANVNKNVDSKVAKVDAAVTKINQVVESSRKSIMSFTGYCNLQPENVCGPCMCRDDPNLLENHYCDCSQLPAKRDCQQFHLEGAKINGIYTIHQNNLRIIRVFCDQQTDSGGWTVFQRRTDGSEKFYRDWQNYRNGFGSLQNEFWLGNRNLYTLASQGIMGNELRVEIGDWVGGRKFAKYSSFQIASEIAKFQLNVAGYSGNAGDSMTSQNGYKFTTYDNDNDIHEGNCAILTLGAWWYHACFDSNLNGVYYDYGRMGTKCTGIHWFGWHNDCSFSFKFIEMKTRRKV